MTAISSAKELLEHGELVDVRFLSLSADLLDEPRPDFEDDDVEQSIQVQYGNGESVIEVRSEATVRTRVADYRVVAATQFRINDGIEFTEEAVAEFAEKVGAMAVYPYLREAVSSLTLRLREAPVTMPLMRQARLVPTEVDLSAESQV